LTERLYYTDSNLLEFDASVVESGTVDNGHYVVLDRTAFYPTSGGQSHDTGILNGIRIHDVVELDDGRVQHRSSQPVGSVGQSVHGVVDRERRRRNCQNHTAQHILSAAFAQLYAWRTMSVHLGEEYGAVELGVDSITNEQLREVEALANRVVSDNIEVETLFVDSDRAQSLPLRKEPQREGKLRVIRIGQFECSACGGTHCSTSGGVGLIKITGTEKIRGRVLVRYLAGGLAADDYRIRFEVTDSLSRALTCHPSDLITRVGRLTADNTDLKKQLADAQRELLPVKAAELSEKATTYKGHNLVVAAADGYDPASAGRLAGLVAAKIAGLAVLTVGGRLILSAAPGSGLHAGNIAKEIAARSDLKGGGNEPVAQLGGAANLNPDTYRSIIRSVLEDA